MTTAGAAAVPLPTSEGVAAAATSAVTAPMPTRLPPSTRPRRALAASQRECRTGFSRKV